MSDEEHSDSEFYNPEDEQEEYDTSLHQFLSNEEGVRPLSPDDK